jgi:phosphoglycolate phosphatase
MAAAAGIESVGVAWGYHGAERLKAAGAARVVESMSELAAHVAPKGA